MCVCGGGVYIETERRSRDTPETACVLPFSPSSAAPLHPTLLHPCCTTTSHLATPLLYPCIPLCCIPASHSAAPSCISRAPFLEQRSRHGFSASHGHASNVRRAGGDDFASVMWEFLGVDLEDGSDDDDDGELEYVIWSADENNVRSSYQSSEQANRRKRAATAAAAAAAAAAGAGQARGRSSGRRRGGARGDVVELDVVSSAGS